MTLDEALAQARGELEAQAFSRAHEILNGQVTELQAALDSLESSRDSRIAAIDQEVSDKKAELASLRDSLGQPQG